MGFYRNIRIKIRKCQAEAFEMAPEELLREIISREEGKHD